MLRSGPVQREPHFQFFGVPVYVEPFHFILSALLGWQLHGMTVSALLYIPIVFMGVLLHEMGHAAAVRRFGASPLIVLGGMGGVTVFRAALTPGRSFIVSFAGPAVGLVLGGAVLLWQMYSPVALPPLAQVAVQDFIWVNFGWALFNLLPIQPLDGGQMLRAVLEKFFAARGVRIAYGISLVAALGMVAVGLSFGSLFTIMMFGFYAMGSYRALTEQSAWAARSAPQKPRVVATPVPPRRGAVSLEAELQRGWQALEEGRPLMVRMIGESLLLRADSPEERYEVIHLVAWGRLLSGDPRAARNALAMLPTGRLPDALLEGAILLELGESGPAVPLLIEGIRGRPDDFVAARLAKAVALSGQIDPVLGLLAKDVDAKGVGARPFQLVVADLFGAKRFAQAAEVGERVFQTFQQAMDAFNVACALGRAQRADEALVWLEKAVDAGLADPKVIDSDGDLAPVRSLPGFQAVREKAGLG